MPDNSTIPILRKYTVEIRSHPKFCFESVTPVRSVASAIFVELGYNDAEVVQIFYGFTQNVREHFTVVLRGLVWRQTEGKYTFDDGHVMKNALQRLIGVEHPANDLGADAAGAFFAYPLPSFAEQIFLELGQRNTKMKE
uniref:Uncharacterized protein n=1 Tax=Romanomermis culicivorax TaxID=13658 RepID=A0A915JFS6_ROMCU